VLDKCPIYLLTYFTCIRANLLTRTGDVERVEAGGGIAEERPRSGGESFDLRRTLPHVLVGLKENDVDFWDEHTRESDRRTDVDAYAQCVDLYLKRTRKLNR